MTCIPCDYNVVRRENELTKIQRKKNKLHQSVEICWKKWCFCIDIYKIYEGDDIHKLFECLSRITNKKLNIKKEVVEKYKNMDEDFEENYYSRTSRGVYKIGHESVRLL